MSRRVYSSAAARQAAYRRRKAGRAGVPESELVTVWGLVRRLSDEQCALVLEWRLACHHAKRNTSDVTFEQLGWLVAQYRAEVGGFRSSCITPESDT